MRHLIDWQSLNRVIWNAAVERALHYYENPGEWTDAARGRSIALMFFNPSLRTRTSMELAAAQLGAYSTVLTPGKETWHFAFEQGAVMDGKEAEHIREAIGVLSRYYDALGVRVFASLKNFNKDREERLIRTIASASSVPVINLESAFYHPCQALADAAVIRRQLGDPRGKKFVLAWTYHPQSAPHGRAQFRRADGCPVGDERDRGATRRLRARLRDHGNGSVLRCTSRRNG